MTVQKCQKQGGCALDNQLNLNNLDKSDWKTYRFDEIAQSISERIDPTNTDLEVYVGLEHIDSQSIHLKRHGQREDVKGQKLRFYSGDVIFGRRHAYQRKAAVATMDGFCSAHALVLRANPDVILPELLPFFIHSDSFMNRAVDISVGSLSPTINWGSLKKEEFIIPSHELQLNLLRLFVSAEKLLSSFIDCSLHLRTCKSSYVSSLFSGAENKSEKITDMNIEIIDGDRGKNYPKSNEYIDEKEGYCLFLNAGNVTKHGFVFDENKFISESKDNLLRKGKLIRSDIVITTRGTVGNVAFYDDSVRYQNMRIN